MMKMSSVGRIISTVSSWPGIHTDELHPSGKDFLLESREIGHVHGERLVDIPFPRNLRDELVVSGRAQPHQLLPNSGWVSVPLETENDVEQAIALLRLSYDLATQN